MNIKRIIREEVDDFDWIKDVSSDFMSFLKQYQSEGDIYKVWIEGISMEDQLTMMDKLYDHGFQWRGGHGRYDTSFVNIPILYLVTDTMEIEWDSGEDNRDTFEDREYETPKTQIPTDDFFNALGMSVNNINESDELDWIKDVKTNQNIAQEIADETKIKNNRLYPPLPPSSPSLLSLPLLRLIIFPLSPTFFTKYCKEQYGLDNEDDINDVWERYKDIIKDKVNNLNESSDFDWIKDVKTNQNIAQEIADETKIKNNRLYPPQSLSPNQHPFNPSSSFPPLFSPSFFTKYCKVEYGLTKGDIDDVWKRYKDIIKDKVNNLNESSDFEWVNDSEPTMTNIYGNEIPINTKEAQDNFKKEVNGNYVISTPIENTDEETVLAFGSVSYIKSVIYHIHKNFPEDQALYFGTIKYSKKEKDNVLSYIRYY